MQQTVERLLVLISRLLAVADLSRGVALAAFRYFSGFAICTGTNCAGLNAGFKS
jgi:hypothetical protein